MATTDKHTAPQAPVAGADQLTECYANDPACGDLVGALMAAQSDLDRDERAGGGGAPLLRAVRNTLARRLRDQLAAARGAKGERGAFVAGYRRAAYVYSDQEENDAEVTERAEREWSERQAPRPSAGPAAVEPACPWCVGPGDLCAEHEEDGDGEEDGDDPCQTCAEGRDCIECAPWRSPAVRASDDTAPTTANVSSWTIRECLADETCPEVLPRVRPENFGRELWHENCPQRGPMRMRRDVTVQIEDGSKLYLHECVACDARVYAGLDAQRRIVHRPAAAPTTEVQHG